MNQRNGYRDRTFETWLGTVELKVPKVRQGTCFPSFLEPRRRREKTGVDPPEFRQQLVALVRQGRSAESLAREFEPTANNAAEREFQRHAKLRGASLFAGSPEGGHRWATLLGLVRTAQKVGVDVQAYLTWMFERRGTHRQRFGLSASQLMPTAYKQHLADRVAAAA